MIYVSFDMEEWYDLIGLDTQAMSEFEIGDRSADDAIYRIVEKLGSLNISATFYVVGKYAEKRVALLRRIVDLGHQIGSHSYSHQDLRSYTCTRKLKDELRKGIDVLQQAIGQEVQDFRAPGFSIDKSNYFVLEIIAELGISRDSSLFVGSHAHGGVRGLPMSPFRLRSSGFSLHEFPIIPAGPIAFRHWNIAGGGYFRLAPYWLIRQGLEASISNSDYFMCYFHPRDFAPGIPRLRLSVNRYFRTYVGLRGARIKFDRLLTDFSDQIASGELSMPPGAPVVDIEAHFSE